MLDKDFDPFQHFTLSETFNVDETLASVQEGLKLVDEELEAIVCRFSLKLLYDPVSIASYKSSRFIWTYISSLTT